MTEHPQILCRADSADQLAGPPKIKFRADRKYNEVIAKSTFIVILQALSSVFGLEWSIVDCNNDFMPDSSSICFIPSGVLASTPQIAR